ncbi:MAG: hypothetical protein HY341_02305 [Candidatus Kerfeldbacteria bacterium]|nr:hypothetical protein [Candidatus Kerfeldbacteria bacterium]
MSTAVAPTYQDVEDEYLGFRIMVHDGTYVAEPKGWIGEILLAETMPQLRRKIWRWWHQLETAR